MTTRIKIAGFWPKHMDRTEARIINNLITSAFARGYLIRVFDGEEFSTGWTNARCCIQEVTHATEYTVFHIGRQVNPGAVERVGSVTLIHGNGCDVISDWSWSSKNPEGEALMDALVAPAQALAETL